MRKVINLGHHTEDVYNFKVLHYRWDKDILDATIFSRCKSDEGDKKYIVSFGVKTSWEVSTLKTEKELWG